MTNSYNGDLRRVRKETEVLVKVSGRWSTYLQEKIIRHVFLGEAYSVPDIYVALLGSLPNYDDSGADLDEPGDMDYSRPQLSSWLSPTKEAETGSHSGNSGSGSFGVAGEDWFCSPSDPQDSVALVDASTEGNLLAFGSTSIDQEICECEEAKIAAGSETSAPLRVALV